MRVPGSILVAFMSPSWESGVGSVLMSTGLVLSSFSHPISEGRGGGAWEFKNEKEGIMETSSHSYSERLIHSALWIEVLFSSV